MILGLLFFLTFFLVSCQHDIADCLPYFDSLEATQSLIATVNSREILSLYPLIWGIIIVRKIFFT